MNYGLLNDATMTLEEFLEEWNNPSDMILVHTSGSTGKPKPMYVEKKRMLNSARITCDFLDLQAGDIAFLCMPLDYIAGKMMVVRSIERHLELKSIVPSGHPLHNFKVDRNRRSLAAMVPLQVYNSLQVPKEAEELKHFTHLIIGGGAIDKQLAEALKDFPNNVWSTYGMTETLSHIALRRLNGAEASDWYKPFEGVTVSSNAEDCLVIDAPLVHDGLLVTNDIVTINAEGYFKIRGRKDNVICTGGIKIQIEEVEDMLKQWLKKPFMITKRSDKKFGETIVLLTEEEDLSIIKQICKQYLPKYWQPNYYIYVRKIPLTETGKPARAMALSLAKEI